MNEKKYEITNIAHPQYPWLHRIRALRDVREDVYAGDLGGYVQSGENLSQDGQSWVAGNAIAAEESYVHGDAILWDYSCVRGNAAVSGPSRIGGNAIVEDYAVITAGYVHGDVHISGNAKLFANSVTGGVPVVMERAAVYGELGGEIEVRENAVILPGITIDNPTSDTIHIGPDDIAIERKFKRESSILTPPPGFQPEQKTTAKKRHWGEER